MRRPFTDYGNIAPVGRVPLFGRLRCRLRGYHLLEHSPAGYDLCGTCRSRWLT